MTAKYGEARRRAFLSALRATGNQTLAAERAKVSRSWVTLHRASDPAFREAIDDAVAEARERLCGHGARKPPTGWGYLDGEELVVKGIGGATMPGERPEGLGVRRVQIARARLRQWSPRVEMRFLAALAATCNVKAACAAVGMTAASAYGHRKRWMGFAARWDAAIEDGFMRLDAGLLEHGGNVFSGEQPEESDVAAAFRAAGPMSFAQALQLLHMHKHRVHGLGKAPGKSWTPPASLDDPAIRESIIRKLEVLVNADPEQLGRDQREWARRRKARDDGRPDSR